MNGSESDSVIDSARVISVSDDMVTILRQESSSQAYIKNEVIYVCPKYEGKETGERLKGEILRVRGLRAEAQIFEDTSGVAVGDRVEQSGEMLSVELGPGLLGQVYDGLQNSLSQLHNEHGKFLQRGVQTQALDRHKKWSFSAKVRAGDRVAPGDILGTVPERRFEHKILAPLNYPHELTVEWIQEGSFTVNTVIAKLRDARGAVHDVTLVQRWPVRVPLPTRLLQNNRCQRQFPSQPMITTVRLIDSFFPIARGGTACIPGPFGAGKTVLQNLISRYSDVDIVLIVACGERAGEVVETITEFPRIQDPHTGKTLMDRTIIVCNTSSMPVAAREASIYTGVTIGEYYRQMGYNVLLLADSTSRWAQAMRETSGRLEEIPGEEAFPAYLESSIRNFYERAGVIETDDGRRGSLTIIGTVSPAGGNFEEPVTQATLNTVKCFLGLSYDRAYKRFYPAVDPLLSWSRYIDQLNPWFSEHIDQEWRGKIQALAELLQAGDDILRMMQVTGEEGITDEDYVTQQKAAFVDFVFLQQDAFDAVDVSTSLTRQKSNIDLITEIVQTEFALADKTAIRNCFNHLTEVFRNMNYAEYDSEPYKRYQNDIVNLLEKPAEESTRFEEKISDKV
jgi:V/A-type H+-transporting ATPase subunit A